MKHLKAFSLISIIFILSACNTLNVYHVGSTYEELPSDQGVFYALPRTWVNVEITITETEKIKGPYAQFASKYLGLNNVNLANTKNFEISDVQLATSVEPDPEHYYYVELKGKNNSRELLIGLSESGLIQSVNDDNEVKLQEQLTIMQENDSKNSNKTFKYFFDDNLIETFDTLTEVVTLDTITFEKKVLRKKMVQKSMEQKAKEAADFIMKVKENRFNIITGYQEVPYEKGTVEYMYSELEKLEEEYLKLFTGMSVTRTHKYRFSFLPDSSDINHSVVLFKFSKTRGVISKDDPDGDLVVVDIQSNESTQKVDEFITTIENKENKVHGFYFRMPELAKFILRQGNQNKAEASFLIPQYGIVTCLPARELKLKFHPNTGAIKNIDL